MWCRRRDSAVHEGRGYPCTQAAVHRRAGDGAEWNLPERRTAGLRRSAGVGSGTRASRAFNPRQCGAGGGIRTLTLRRMGDFESPASAIPPLRPDDHSHPHRLSGQASIDGRTIQVLRISHSRPRRTSDRRPIQSAAMTSAVSASRARAFGSTSGNGKSPSSLVGMRWMWT